MAGPLAPRRAGGAGRQIGCDSCQLTPQVSRGKLGKCLFAELKRLAARLILVSKTGAPRVARVPKRRGPRPARRAFASALCAALKLR